MKLLRIISNIIWSVAFEKHNNFISSSICPGTAGNDSSRPAFKAV